MAYLKANFAQGTLDGTLAQSAAQVTVDAGHSLPEDVGKTFQLVIWDANTYPNPADDPDVEIVSAVYNASNVYDITRAQEGTADVEHGDEQTAGLHFTAAQADEFLVSDGSVAADLLVISGVTAIGLDLSGGTFSSCDMNLTANPVIFANAGRLMEFDSGVDHNLFIGHDCFKDEDGSFNLGIGEHAGENNSIAGGGNNGTANLFIGHRAGEGDSGGMTGFSNLGIGYLSLLSLTSGYDNCAVGVATMRLATSAYNCMAFGDGALYSCSQGHDNIGIGYNAGYNVTTGDYGTFVGSHSGDAVTANSGNTAFGAYSWSKGTGSQNTAIGGSAAANLVAGDDNVIIGSAAFFGPTAGHRNIVFGRNAGRRQSGTVNDMLMFDNRDRGSSDNELAQAIIIGAMAAAAADQTITFNVGTFAINGGVDTDVTINFTGTTNSGVLSWMEDEDYFKLADDLLMDGAEKVILRDTAIGIYSQADTFLDLFADGAVRIGNSAAGAPTNSSNFEPDGTLVFEGAATVWEDVQFSVSKGRVPASNFPDYAVFTTNTKEFQFAVDDYIDLESNEVLHKWREGTDGHVHLHVALDDANSSGDDRFAKFTIYLAYVNSSSIWVETSLTAELTIPDGSSSLEAFYLDIGDLTLSGLEIGTQIKSRVKRIAATGGTEYADHIFVNQCGCHLECDMVGSRLEASK